MEDPKWMIKLLDFTRRCRIRTEDDDVDGTDAKRVRGPNGKDIGKKLINMISRVDEDIKNTLEDALGELASTLEQNLEPYEGQIVSILSECAMYLPEKLTMFTTLIGILNAKSPEFGLNMVVKLVTTLNECFAEENYDVALRLITFICDLGNVGVLDIQPIVGLLERFANLAVEDNIRSDFYVYVVMHALPWIGPRLQESKPIELDKLLERIGNYLSKRGKVYVKMLQVWPSRVPHLQEDYLDCLWTQIQKLRKEEWVEHHIVRLCSSFKSITEQEGVVHHKLPSIDLGQSEVESNKKFPLPKIVFRLFDYTDIQENMDQALPPDTSIERFLVEEDLNWIIDNNYLEWHLCAKALLNYHRRDAVPVDYVIIEVVFGQLFRLPRSSHLEMFYGALLIELCRTKPDSMPQVLAQATELLYQRADSMQQMCLDRFVDWFSYHLSNFQYRWSWSDWAGCLTLDSLHPRQIFVREVIEKCMRLSYYKKVVEFLPSAFDEIIPKEPAIIYLLDDDKHNLREYARDFYDMMSQKRPADEILRMLEKPRSEDDKEDSISYDPNYVAVFTAVLLKLASRTFSHSFAALTKYHNVFRTVVEKSKEMQAVILCTLFDCWMNHKQMMTILVDKMLKMQIVDPAVVQAWVFCDEMKREFKRSWVWDTLNTAIRLLENHHAKLTSNQKDLLEKISRLRSKPTDVEEKMDDDTNATVGDKNSDAKTGGNLRPEIEFLEAKPTDAMDVDEAVMDSDFEDHDDSPAKKFEKKLVENATNLDEVEESLRNILLGTCHKFTLILTEHLSSCENGNTEIETDFYNYVLGRFRHVFLTHSETMWKYADFLDRELFNSPEIEPRIRDIFLQFQSLKN